MLKNRLILLVIIVYINFGMIEDKIFFFKYLSYFIHISFYMYLYLTLNIHNNNTIKFYTSNNVPRGLVLFGSVSGGGIAFRLFIPFLSNCFSIIRALLAYESATSLCRYKIYILNTYSFFLTEEKYKYVKY